MGWYVTLFKTLVVGECEIFPFVSSEIRRMTLGTVCVCVTFVLVFLFFFGVLGIISHCRVTEEVRSIWFQELRF